MTSRRRFGGHMASLVALVSILVACSAGPSAFPSAASPDATASAPDPSPSAEGSPSTVPATASPLATPLPPRPEQLPYLPPLSRAQVVSATLNVREEPSLDARVVATLTAGDEVHVWGSFDAWGPVASGGVVWYPIETGDIRGWAAKGAGSGVYYLEPIPDACPRAAGLASLLAASAWERVSCIGSDQLQLSGVTEIACQGGVREATYEPSWLAAWCPPFVLTDRQRPDGPITGRLNLAFPPDLSLPDELRNGSIVEVSGHFDDPAAAACKIEPKSTYQWNDRSLWVLCREQFVVTDVEVVGDLGLPAGA